jgi:hypothetical protein
MATLVNNYPGSRIYTTAQLAAFINNAPEHLISYATNRNPSAVYEYIKRNYPQFGRLANGMQATDDGISQMYSYLVTQFNAVPAAARRHWVQEFAKSIPKPAEKTNWTTPA